jgi:hypothetical protein
MIKMTLNVSLMSKIVKIYKVQKKKKTFYRGLMTFRNKSRIENKSLIRKWKKTLILNSSSILRELKWIS